MLEGRWFKVDGASPEALSGLRVVAPASLPQTYYDLLAYSNGGEGPLCVQPLWLSLFPAEEVVRLALAGTFRDAFPNLLVIGSNGAGEAVALDLGAPQPHPVVAFDLSNGEGAEALQPMADSFDTLLTLIGYDEELT